MGRYYNGDIDGKFWFAVQSSDAADRFGVTGTHPEEIVYYFEKDDLKSVKNELTKIENNIGKKNIQILDDFFEKTSGYNDKIMKEHNIDINMWNKYKTDDSDWFLGVKIRNCIEEEGQCHFTAEC